MFPSFMPQASPARGRQGIGARISAAKPAVAPAG